MPLPMNKNQNIETIAVKSADYSLTDTRPVSPPLYLSTTYHRSEDGSYTNDFVYTRSGNPNRELLEKSLAELEKGTVAFAFASGMAAISALFQSLEPGDHVILPDDVYFNVRTLCTEVFERWGLAFTWVDMTDLSKIEEALRPETALIWAESPSNPQLKITDIAAVARLAKERKCLLAVDNTWPSPVLQQPLDLGADIVMHSTTKYFGGHSDVLGGCIVLKEEGPLSKRMSHVQTLSGAVPSPFDCWLIGRGIQTLPLRVKAQSKNAAALAHYLEEHPAIMKVNYPGLRSHPQYSVALAQMKEGFGAMLSVLVKGNAEKAITVANALRLFTTATSLGGVESLVEHRRSVEGDKSTTPANLLRISVGLEHIDDMIADWDQALAKK